MYNQISAFLFGLIATATCTTTTFWSMWACSGTESHGITGTVTTWKNIWGICLQYDDGQYQCIEDINLLEMDGYLIALRAFMCAGIVLSGLACFATLVGLQCSRVLEDNLSKKRVLMFASGFMHGTTALLTLASMAWFTGLIIQEYFSFESQDNVFRYELGGAVYLGYFSSLISLIASLCCFCMAGPKEDRDNRDSFLPAYRYKDSRASYEVKKPLTEYV